MSKESEKKTRDHWINVAQRLQAIAQTGLSFSNNPFDAQRYNMILEIASEITANYSTLSSEEIFDLFANERGYATPKIDVRAAVFHENKILLVKERDNTGWSLPGGWADIGQSPGECVIREVKEESGFDVEAVKLIAIHDRDRHNHPKMPFYVYKIVFLCRFLGGCASTSIETSDAGFFDEDKIPPLSAIRITPEQIRRYFCFYRNPDTPADFD